VALTTLDEKTLKRELRPLQKLNNSYPKFSLTLDEINPNANYEGIRKINALEWLLDPVSRLEIVHKKHCSRSRSDEWFWLFSYIL
jgi:hypothetical protein